MANKKQQKRRQDRRKGAPGEVGDEQSPATDRDGDPSEDATSADERHHQAAGGANIERREQKDLVRQQKERELRRIQRNDMLRKVGTGLVIVAVIVGGILFLTGRRQAQDAEVEGLLAQAKAAAVEAGCGDVETIEPYGITEEEDAGHVSQMPGLDTYKSIPPVSGPHDEATEVAGVKPDPPKLGSVIHSMEHGAATIWYRPGTQSGAEFADIKDFVERNQDHVILAPYDYPEADPGGELPEGIDMSLSAWHRQQNCEALSLPVVVQFLYEYRSPPVGGGTYKGEAPEQGALI